MDGVYSCLAREFQSPSPALAPPRCQNCCSTGPSFSPHYSTAQHSTAQHLITDQSPLCTMLVHYPVTQLSNMLTSELLVRSVV